MLVKHGVFQHNVTMAVMQGGSHPHAPGLPSLPDGVVITEQQLAAIYKFLLDMNFSSSRKMRLPKLYMIMIGASTILDRGPSLDDGRLTTLRERGQNSPHLSVQDGSVIFG